MKKFPVIAAFTGLVMTAPLSAQEDAKPHPSPGQIVQQAEAQEWVDIKASDLLVMDLAADRDGNDRQVILQLMPEPFSQGWVRNIRKLAGAGYWDGTAVVRVQDNYVVQWGDPAEEEKDRKALPDGLEVMAESEYVTTDSGFGQPREFVKEHSHSNRLLPNSQFGPDSYAQFAKHVSGWPIARYLDGTNAPVHCYGMVGVGRGLSPNTGDGSSLYTVIGHAPRHLDRNIALVGRIIAGIEHLSSLRRGKGTLGFYEDKSKQTAITAVRLASDLPEDEQPKFQYLSTEGKTFAKYAEARANRRDPFFIKPAGGADICNIPVPIRRVKESK